MAMLSAASVSCVLQMQRVLHPNHGSRSVLQAYVNKLAFAHSDLPIVRMLVDEADAIADGLLQVVQHIDCTQRSPPNPRHIQHIVFPKIRRCQANLPVSM